MLLYRQHEWSWLSYVSVGCVISYVVCFAVGLGMINGFN